jgi:hypothetical protein
VWTSRPSAGLWLRRRGLLLTPEETAPPPELVALRRGISETPEPPEAQTPVPAEAIPPPGALPCGNGISALNGAPEANGTSSAEGTLSPGGELSHAAPGVPAAKNGHDYYTAQQRSG